MRISMVTLFLCFAVSATAQSRLLKTEISITAKDVSIEKVLEMVTAHYKVIFSYGKDNLDLGAMTSIEATNVPLDKFLEQLLTPFDISFAVIGNQVVLKKKTSSAPGTKKSARQILGVVRDAVTSEPLSFASVSLTGSSSGTITNADGEFLLLVPAGADDTLKISYLGYATATVALADKDLKALVVRLVPVATQLQSVEVEARSPESVVLEAIRRIPDNYRTAPYRQTFYLRDRTWADGSPIQATESVYESYRGDVLQEDYRKQVKLLGARRSRYDKTYEEIQQAFRALNGFDIGVTAYFIFDGDLARHTSPETFMGKGNWKHYQFQQEENTVYDGREVYVIAFDQKDVNKSLMKGKFYIDTETYAFIHVSQSLSPIGVNHAEIFGPKVLEKIFGLGENVVVDRALEKHYRQINGKWFLDHMTVKPQLSLIKSKRKFNASILSESNLVVTEIDTVNILPFADEEVTAARKLAYRRYGEYDYDFWKDQNVIKPDASFDEAFARIEAKNGTAKSQGDNSIVSSTDDDSENFSADWTTPSLDLTKGFSHFRIHYSTTDSLIVDSINVVLERERARILEAYEVRRMPKVDIYVYPSIEAYHASINYPNAPGWMVGSATINKFSIVSPLNPGPAHSYSSVMKGIVHEFVHCVHIHIVKHNMSKVRDNDARWLWESLACYEGGQYVDPKTLDYLTGPITLESLNDAETGDRIYDLGFVLIDFIRTTWSQKAILKLIKTNGDLEKSLRVTEEEFEALWWRYLSARVK